MAVEQDIRINQKYHSLLECQKRYLVLWGGGGSGKSVFAAQKILLRCLTEKEAKHRILCIRKVKETIRESVFSLLRDLLLDMEMYDRAMINKTEMSFTFDNGNQIIMAGVDDPEKLKSIAGITSIWIEEPTELEEKEFDQIDLRLRGETKEYKQIILSFNPVDEQHWIKKKFFDVENPEVEALHSSYKDNAFLDDDYIRLLEDRFKHDENLYRIYVKGAWGRVKLGSEFYTGFKRSEHVQPTPFLPGVTCHLSFDFNVLPYMSLLCAQILSPDNTPDKKLHIRIFKEYCLKSPLNSVEAICKTFIRDYEQYKPVVLYYGDATGKNRIAGQGDKRNFYDVETYLFKHLTHASDRVAKRNPNVLKRRDVINRMLAGGYNLQFSIDPSCSELINDLDYGKLGIDGKLKEMFNDKVLGERYQKGQHQGDCFDYLLIGLYPNEFKF
jgi:phage terminase large subunit